MKRFLPLLSTLILAVILRTMLLSTNSVPFNADEAVVGLMARHILQGARPVFFYGQAYMGSLDAWLVAGAFAILGPSVFAIRLVQTLLYLGIVLTTYLLGWKIYASRWMAGVAALFIALPTVLVTLYTTASLGGYGETLLIGNILLLLTLALGRQTERSAPGGWLLFGLLGGLGFWAFPLIGVYLLPCVICLFIMRRQHPLASLHFIVPWSLAALGFAIGAAPWFSYTFTHGWITLTEMGGSAIAGVSPAQPLLAIFEHLFYFLLLGLTVIFGMRPPWNAEFLALPLVPYALVIYAALILFSARRTISIHDAARPGRWLLLGQALTLVVAFVFTPFGADPSGRYFLPLAVPSAIFLAEMLSPYRAWQHHPNLPEKLGSWLWRGRTLVLSVVIFNWWGNVQCAANFPPGITTQFAPETRVDQRNLLELKDFLLTRPIPETYGYTNYWVEYPLAFLSNEELIYEARLPYHRDFRYTPRDNRYAPYTKAVATSPRAAYITTLHPVLDERIRGGLIQLGVTFQEQIIGDFHVFYNLSRKVTPDELNLSEK